jgi:hypothetical protein
MRMWPRRRGGKRGGHADRPTNGPAAYAGSPTGPHIGPTLARTSIGQAAQALNTAVRDVRDRFPRTPSLWAAYLHADA